MRKRFIFFAISVFFALELAAQQQSVMVLSRCKQDGVWLRWAPVNAAFWKLGNKYGYTIERFTMTTGGDLEPGSQVMLTNVPIKPLSQAEFAPLSERNDEVAALEELLYGEDYNATTFSANDLSSILKKNSDDENRFGIAMLMCDLSSEAARAAGLFYHDTRAEKGKRYIYRISISSSASNVSLEPAVIFVNVTDEIPLMSIKDLQVQFDNRKTSISWSTLLHKGIYSAYYIERSTNGKNFKKLTDLPYVHMSEAPETETAYYVDSLENNTQTYHYRIQGISPFAEAGPYSNIVKGTGKENLFGMLTLRETFVFEQNKVRFRWEFPKEMEQYIAGFQVGRANNAEGPYDDVLKKPLTKDIRETIDVTPYNNTYYVIKAVDNAGKEVTRSFPYLVHVEDNVPPKIPTGITGSIEKNGVTKISWSKNTDADLQGYRVFRSNGLQEEPVEVTRDIIESNSFIDTVNTRVLNKKLYYHVVAIDKNYNISEYSAPFALSRPDILPPAPAAFYRAELLKDTIALQWNNSVSDDVVRYELIRIEKESKIIRPILSWTPKTPLEKYKDRSLTPGHTYSYKIVASDSAGNQSETTSREIRYEPGFRSAVTDIKASVNREGKEIKLQWKNNSPSNKCIIYRKINNNPFTIYQTLEGNIESFTDKTISINNIYSYKIQPVFTKGIKAIISDEVRVTY